MYTGQHSTAHSIAEYSKAEQNRTKGIAEKNWEERREEQRGAGAQSKMRQTKQTLNSHPDCPLSTMFGPVPVRVAVPPMLAP